ncbi:MAG TPA: PEGA domain-containing protein [Bacteroidales bacterium]|nr:PEGA domain-containing protein [Bacteroidales bacterium]
MKNQVLLFTAILLLASGCATILTGTTDNITFSSTPQGATVYKDGLELCKTPCTVPVKRSLNKTDIEFSLDGYQTRYFTLDKEMNVVSIINLGNMCGWAIDASTGSLFRYSRKSYDLEMKLNSLSVNSNPSEIRINTIENTVDIYSIKK